MATATPIKPSLKAISRDRSPLALWHLLSLDAPTVAALWTWFIASANHVHLPLASTLAMAITVWMLYAGDRLLDARVLNMNQAHHEDLEARHFFHHRHRSAFLIAILFASIALAALLPRLDAEAIRLYLVLGSLVIGYFLLIHATNSAHRLPKEIAVGLFFAAATFIPTVARHPDLRLALLPAALLFATLCSLNCLFIYAWEHEEGCTNHPAHAITRRAVRNLPLLTVLLALCGAALTLLSHETPWSIPCAIAYCAALLFLLHTHHLVIKPVSLRAAADLALTAPLLLLPFLHQ